MAFMSFRFLRSATSRSFALWGAAVVGGLIALYVALLFDGWRMDGDALLHPHEENFDSGQTGENFWQAKIFKQLGPDTIVFENKEQEEIFSYQFEDGSISDPFYLFKDKEKSFFVGVWYIGNQSNIVQAIDPLEKKVSKIVYCDSESLVELKANKVSVLCELERGGSFVRTDWPK